MRGAWLSAAPLVVTLLFATGCTGSSEAGPASSANVTPTASASPATTDPAAAQAVRRAIASTRRLREYAFAATTSVGSTRPTRSRLEGRVVRGQGLTYRLSVGGVQTQVVRLRHVTFARKVPGKWARDHPPNSNVNPTATLLALLRGFAPSGDVEGRQRVRAIRGTVQAAAARAAGLPDPVGVVRAVLGVDGRGRVVGRLVRTATAVGDRAVAVVISTTYSRFGDVPAIRRPV